MKPVVRFTLRQAVFLNVLFVILLIAGVFSLVSLPVENWPVVDLGKVFIHTNYYGASSGDVEQLVTRELEDALDDLEDVEYIQSFSYRNFSSIEVKFIDDTDYKDLYDELRFRALNALEELPEGAEEPSFLFVDTYAWQPVVTVNLSGSMPQRSLKLLAEELKAELLSIDDVRNVDIRGEYEREFHVSLDPEKLRRLGVTFDQVSAAITAANTKIPTGRFRTETGTYVLETGNRMESQAEVLDVVVRRDGDGSFVRVRDLVTNARLTHRDPYVIPSVDGKDTLRLWVIKEDDGNAVTVSDKVRAVSRRFVEDRAGEDLEVVFTQDSKIEINDSVNTLGGNLLLGMALVVAVLWYTLGFRNALLTAIGIPFSFLCTLIIMYATGLTLNTITLFSFVLVTGIMVDDAVIIIENVYRHMQMGKGKKEAIVDGTAEVMLPVFASALTTVLAFLPMLIMTGSTGEFFSYVPKTVTYALAASLLEALFILPVHIMDWGPKASTREVVDEDIDPFAHLQSGIFAHIWKAYRAVVQMLMKHKAATLCVVTGLFFASVVILVLSALGIRTLIPVKFFPGNYFRYHVTLSLPVGTPIEVTDEVVRDLSRKIMSYGPGQAQSTSGAAGYYEDEDFQRKSGDHHGQIIVTLPEDEIRNFPDNPKDDPMRHLQFIREALRDHIRAKYADSRFQPEVKVFEESTGPPAGKDVNIRVSAHTLARAEEGAERILAFMRGEPELKDLREIEDNRPEYQRAAVFKPDEERIWEYGLTPSAVTAVVAGALNGLPAGRYRTRYEEVDLMVRLARDYDKANPAKAGLEHPADVLDVPVVEHSAAPILVRDVVSLEYEWEPNVLAGYKGQPTVTIKADILEGSDLSSARVTKLVEDFIGNNEMAGTAVSFGGEFDATRRSYQSLAYAFAIALLGIYMVLSSQFNNYFQPFIIISAVPFAFTGVVLGLFLTGTTFTIGSFMAVVGLAGVAVNNSLLLIDFINNRVAAGKPLRDAILESCAARMRPVIITTVTTTLGLLPMAIGIPRKSLSWSPMAMAFVAGLAMSTILTLLVVPIEYEMFDKLRRFAQKVKRGRHEPEIPEPQAPGHSR
ncbi:MAG: efflux RND transporter permease subunit [Desulfatibacillaceae bacterium]